MPDRDLATIHHGDCLATLDGLPEASVDAIVTDPPYGLGFMGKAWDDLPPGEEWAEACYRVLKPGGHLLAFGGTRTWHRLAVAIEDAGFEMRDSIAWLYGSGFPKSLDVSKAIDKAAGVEREVVGSRKLGGNAAQSTQEKGGTYASNTNSVGVAAIDVPVTAPATDAARTWQGWGTALKPAFEPIVVARKPLVGTVAANVLTHGTGALNINGCRIGDEVVTTHSRGSTTAHAKRPGETTVEESGRKVAQNRPEFVGVERAGRWPANVVLDESQADTLDQQSGHQRDGVAVNRNRTERKPTVAGFGPRNIEATDVTYGGGGGASRFFYVAKAPKKERPNVDGIAHPTVKPLTLMRWLVRLVTPPGGVVLDPFAGSGTTIEAAILEGFHVIGIEREAEYLPLIQHRINRQAPDPDEQLDLLA